MTMDITRIKRLILTFDFFLGFELTAGLVDCFMKVFYIKNQHFVKGGGGTPNPFTVSQMPFFRSFISKAFFFASFYRIYEGINKKARKLILDCLINKD
jgi:hypothetical protein